PALAGPDYAPVREIIGKVSTLLAGEDALYVRRGSGDTPEVTLVTEPSAGTDGAATLDSLFSRGKLRRPIARANIHDIGVRTLPLGGGTAVHYANVGSSLVVTDLPSGIVELANGGAGL